MIQLPSAAIAALERGSKIEAIKHVRESQGVGLKEAKEIVEAYIDGNPDMRQRMHSANSASAGGAIRLLLLLAAVAIIIYYYFFSARS